MKKKLSIIIGICTMFTLFLIYELLIFPNQNKVHNTLAAGLFGTDLTLDIPPATGVRGTQENPFIILEIVPYEGIAEIGYMIKGAEPIALERMIFDTQSANIAASTRGFDVSWQPEYTFDIPLGDVIGANERNGEWQANSMKIQYGYYQKVDPGTGTFKQVAYGSNYTYVEVSLGDASGNYLWIPYEINQADSTKTTNHLENQVHTYRNRMEYHRYRNVYTYNNKFLLHSLKIPENQLEDYKIQVMTMTPKELNQEGNQKWIDRADLIIFSYKEHVGSLSKVWEKYYPDKKLDNPAKNYSENDLTWESVVKILKKASQDTTHYAPVIFDVGVYDMDYSYGGNITIEKKYSNGVKENLNAKGTINNVTKLYIAMQQMTPAKFVHDYIEAGLVISVPVKDSSGNPIYNGVVPLTTGYVIELAKTPVNSNTYYKKGSADSAAVWSIYTLLPYHMFSNNHGYSWTTWDEGWKQVGITNYRVNVSNSDNQSVRNSFYSFNGNNSLNMVITNEYISFSAYSQEAFDFYGKTSGSITPASAIYYLLHKQAISYQKDIIRILEIEPSNDFIWDGTSIPWNVINDTSNGSAYARQYYTKFFPNFRGKVAITIMTSAEFIGKIDDLNKTYDLIFFGLRDGALRKSGSITVYNDSTLQGKVYLHNGDTIKSMNNKLLGLSGVTEENTYRFSGNDITLLKLNELKDFMKADKPILLDIGFYTSSSRTGINTTKIDKASFIYELADLNIAGMNPVPLYYADSVNVSSNLETLLAKKPFTLQFGNMAGTIEEKDAYPIVYRDRTRPVYQSLTDHEIFVNGSNSSFRTLRYQFYIKEGTANSSNYTVKLYIDINADGKYDQSIENVDNLSIVDEGGNAISYDQLRAGVDYKITRKLEEEYYGILPWKIEIVSNNNDAIRDSQINFCALKTTNKINLNILQIKADSNNNVNLATHPLFHDYIQDLNDYELSFATWTVSEFISKVGTGDYRYVLKDDDDNHGVINLDNVITKFDDDGDGYYDFDMLILGFADMYTDIGNKNALQNIEDFIEEGKTILFTHDTTSFVNRPKGSDPNLYYTDADFWGYGLNKRFRNILGMDRFGVTLGTVAERSAAYKDYTSKNSANVKRYDGYMQGYSNLILNRYAKTSWKSSHPNVNYSTFEDEFKSNTVTNVNHGQITKYPYEIDDKFKVATTHAQYYQLDMESPEMVVWYTLSDDKGGIGMYSTTPNDVRNNYYIYNKGNITYSGVGHSALIDPMEVKLFVNTMIAAYSATAKAAKVDITNRNSSTDKTGKSYVYVDYDIYNTQQAFGTEVKVSGGQYQQLKYRFTENNVLFNKKIKVEYYTVKETIAPDGTIAKTDEPIIFSTRYVNSDNVVSEYKSGEDYYIMLPLSDLDDSNQSKIYKIRITIQYGKLSDKYMTTNKEFILMRRGLFDLD